MNLETAVKRPVFFSFSKGLRHFLRKFALGETIVYALEKKTFE